MEVGLLHTCSKEGGADLPQMFPRQREFFPLNLNSPPMGCKRGKLNRGRTTVYSVGPTRAVCANMNIILDLSKVLAGTIEDQIAWFQARGLFSQQRSCSACGTVMNLQKRNDIQDKYR